MPDEWRQLPEAESAAWRAVLGIRSELNLLLEKARADKALGASLEAKVGLGPGGARPCTGQLASALPCGARSRTGHPSGAPLRPGCSAASLERSQAIALCRLSALGRAPVARKCRGRLAVQTSERPHPEQHGPT